MNSRTRVLVTLALAGVCSLAASTTAVAATKHSTLRVEAGGQSLDPGTNYSNASITSRNSSDCGERHSKRERLEGPNAMGIVGHASRVNQRLRPFRTSDTFEFGNIVCRIGDFVGFESRAWLYKVNHEFASVAGDQLEVGRRDDVLWYFANFTTGENTGDELGLLGVPDRVQPGEAFEVTAVAYSPSGRRSSAAGVRVSGAGATAPQPTTADGRTTVVAQRSGVVRLRGQRGNDIPTAPVEVCVNENLTSCPEVRGETFVGTGRADKIVATRGADRVRARGGRDFVRGRGGNDFINVRGGGRDWVICGGGLRDVVRASRNDRVRRSSCEVIKR